LVRWQKGSFVAQPRKLISDTLGDGLKLRWAEGLINFLGPGERSGETPTKF
jgi:hypothetical protein